MDLYILKIKLQIHEKFMKIFNNMSKNEFNNLEQFQKKTIKINDYF